MTSTEAQDPRLAALAPFMAAVKQNIQNYRTLEAQVAAAEGDRDTAVRAWMESSTDDEAVALREAIQRANAKLKELANMAVQDTVVSDEDKAKLKSEFETVTKQVKASSRALKGLADPFGMDIVPVLREMGDPFTAKETTGTGSGLPRPSVNVEVVKTELNGNTTTWQFENLGNAAKAADIPLEELGKLYAEAGGVPYEDIAKIKEPKEFTFHNPNIPNSSTWTFRTTPKASARGREAVSSTNNKPKDPQELPAAALTSAAS